jgi:hypothetical protein
MQSCFRFILFLPLLFLLTCSKNLFRSSAEEKSDTYRIDRARKEIDEEDFDTALEYILPVWEKKPNDPDVGYITANAYAGRAGLRIINLISEIASKISTKSVIEILAEHFEGADTSDIADMENSIVAIENIGARGALRTAKVNFVALFIYWARLGVNLNYYAYTSGNAKRGTFNACKIATDFGGGATGLPDDIVDRLMVTVPRILDTAAYVSSVSADFDELIDSDLPNVTDFTALPCSADSNNVLCLGVRSLVNLGKGTVPEGIGLGTGTPCVVTIP